LIWLARLVGGILIAVGIVPLTPLIWLLVVFQVSWWPFPVRIAFWQTQSLGFALVVAGFALLVAARPRR
jgi:hypothetical protein